MNKVIVFAYGVISYILFLVAFLYAIAFVGDFAVSKTINTGIETSFSKALIINLVLLAIFAIQHSIMARSWFKKWFALYIPPAAERSTFVLLTSLILFLIYWQWRPMPTVVWEVENQAGVVLLYGIFAIGWLIVLLSTFMINHFELFGLKQVYAYLKDIELKPEPFKRRYLYKYVRHPLMLGFIIAFWFIPVMTIGHLVFAITTTLYILIAVKFFEERDLRRMHGKEYEEYEKEVSMLIPRR